MRTPAPALFAALLVGGGLAPGLRAQAPSTAEPAGASRSTAVKRFEVQVLPPDDILHFTPRVELPGRPRITLALSGGGARGVAHIGVLERMDADGFPVDAITGTSIGAFVGGLYAAGYSGREIEDLFRTQDFNRAFLDLLRRRPGQTFSEQEAQDAPLLRLESDQGGFRFAQGLQSGLPLQRVLASLFARAAYFSGGDFDQLRVPFRALATDLQTGEGRVFAKGDLAESIRASMTVPGGFRPVSIDGQPYVDGALVENLPVDTAKVQFPGSFVLAVDISSPLASGPATSIFSVAARSLDLTIERRQWESRRDADFLVRPALGDVPFADYSTHFEESVEAGRQAFESRRADLAQALQARWPSAPLPEGTRIAVDAPGLPPEADAAFVWLRPAAAQPTERDVYLVLQQLLARGWARTAWAELRPGPALVIHATPWPAVKAWRIEAPDAPEDLRASLAAEAAEALPPGTRFDPMAFGALLGRVVHARILADAPLADVRGSGFDPATGIATLALKEPRVRAIELRPPAGLRLRLDYLKELMLPLMDRPVRMSDLQRRVALGEERLDLGELRWRQLPSSPGAVELDLVPVPQRKQAIDASLGYETTLGGQWGLGYAARNLGGSGIGLDLSAARNRLQQQVSATVRGPFRGYPGAGLELDVSLQEQRLETLFPLPSEELQGLPWDAKVRSLDGALGIYLRFGREGTGKLDLALGARRATYLDGGPGLDRRERTAALSAEWDTLDRISLPRQGLLLRARVLAGRADAGAFPGSDFTAAYVRARGLRALGAHVGLDLDLEGGTGTRLPLDRWWPYGGNGTLLGSDALSLLAPSFAAARLGFPLRFRGALGLDFEVEPRLDVARFAGPTQSLTGGSAIRAVGSGLLLRTTLLSLSVEAGYGFLRLQNAPGLDGRTHGSFHVAVATQPFDLWTRH
ncbi:MAG TPA: patatin-like phospholipase family protein [Holophagaceae bacterium]|nr:patatin-like phospholipase family protein [Holophagaceae bacterium]